MTWDEGATMTQNERRTWLIKWLLAERADYAQVQVPDDAEGQRALLRALVNVRPPKPVTDEFLAVQDAYLAQRIQQRGVTQVRELVPVAEDGPLARVRLWQGDITTLAADAIVNAANDQMLGCFVPGHSCIDNAIHTFAGVQLRLACAEVMASRGRPEPTGTATVTDGYNLPARRVVHTVGPIVAGRRPGAREEFLLRSCYRSCLDAAHDAGCESVAFCCISTGVFGYPADAAARVAVNTVAEWLEGDGSGMVVVFNVFTDTDLHIYQQLLGLD